VLSDNLSLMNLDTYQGAYFPQLQSIIFNALRQEYQQQQEGEPDNVTLDKLATEAAGLIVKALREYKKEEPDGSRSPTD
jgi:hypothetical protein